MKNTLVIVTSNRDIKKETARALDVLTAAGADRLDVDGINDVSIARNIALTKALRLHSDREIFLLVDDDMLFTLEEAQLLVDYVREHNRPASATYVIGTGHLSARHLKGDCWQTGLGFFALTRTQLQDLADHSTQGIATPGDTDTIFQFCKAELRTNPKNKSGPLLWEPEDFCFTRRLGNVALLPIRARHLKVMALQPNDTIEAFIRNAESSEL